MVLSSVGRFNVDIGKILHSNRSLVISYISLLRWKEFGSFKYPLLNTIVSDEIPLIHCKLRLPGMGLVIENFLWIVYLRVFDASVFQS